MSFLNDRLSEENKKMDAQIDAQKMLSNMISNMISKALLENDSVPEEVKESVRTLDALMGLHESIGRINDLITDTDEKELDYDKLHEVRQYIELVKLGVDQFYEGIRGDFNGNK